MLLRLSNLLWDARKNLRLIYAIVKDKRVPTWKKVVPLAPLLYLLLPFNIISFAIPVLGQIDDILVLTLSMKLFEYVIDDKILADHQLRTEKKIKRQRR